MLKKNEPGEVVSDIKRNVRLAGGLSGNPTWPIVFKLRVVVIYGGTELGEGAEAINKR